MVAAADPPRTGRRGVSKRQGLVALPVIDLRPQPDAEFQFSLQFTKGDDAS